MNRQRVFISHANPADNDAAAWLAAKLTALGYNVWVDVEKLKGGETIWREIEPVLRNDCRSLILLLSRSTFGTDGLLRQGVEREMELGLTLEKEHPEFVLPWILDDLAFSQLPIQIHGKMSISERRWSAALTRILEYLGSIGIEPTNEPTGASLLRQLLIPENIGITNNPTTYDINRLECVQLPSKLFAVVDDLSISNEVVSGAVNAGRRFSFHLRKGPTRLFGHDMPVEYLLAESLQTGIEKHELSPSDVKRLVVELVRKSLQAQLLQRGLKELQRPSRGSVYFFNKATVPKGKVSVKLPENSRRSHRHVWGKHKGLYWHLGIEISVGLSERCYVILIPHIVFTRDGVSEPLDPDPNRDRRIQHQKRRSIAKLWFNDKWRGFYYPLLEFWKGDSQEIVVEFAENTPLIFSSTLSTLQVPLTHEKVTSLQPDEYVESDEEEELE